MSYNVEMQIGQESLTMIIGYARTSTTDQTAGLAAQSRDLTAAGAERIFSEQVSSVASRARLAECLTFLKAAPPGRRQFRCRCSRKRWSFSRVRTEGYCRLGPMTCRVWRPTKAT
jgi:hypothetical protein